MQKGARDYFMGGDMDNNLLIRSVCEVVEREQAEETFKKTFDNFEEQVTEQEKIQAQLIQIRKMDSVKKIAGGLTHDLNNLLTAIISCSSFLLENLNKNDTMRQDIDQIRRPGNGPGFW